MTLMYRDNKDPWTGKDKDPDQGPPELDELFRKLNRKFKSTFGKGNLPGGSLGGGPLGSGGFWSIIGLVVVVFLLIWGLSGIFVVSPAEKGVIQRFGRYEQTVGPGVHWIPHFIKSVQVVNVKQVHHYTYQSEMLTEDENIVSVKLTVQYRVREPKNYLFNVVTPQLSLQQATKSALRQVVGRSKLEHILTTGREEIRNKVSHLLNNILAQYQTGIEITDVALQDANPPQEVQDAFDDAVKAREDAQRFINKAEVYRSKIVPKARGQASRILESAQAYQKRITLQAQADVQPYLALLDVYHQAPDVTKYRLYMRALEKALRHSNKVVFDTAKGDKPLFYMPFPGYRGQKAQTKRMPKSQVEQQKETPQAQERTKANENALIVKRPQYPERGSY